MSKQKQKQRKGDFSQLRFKAIKDWNCSDVVKKRSPGLTWWCFWAITNILKCMIFYTFCLDSGTFILIVIWSMLACHLYQPGVTLFLSLFLEIQWHYPFCTLHCFMHFQDSQTFFWRFLPNYQLLIIELSAGWRQYGIKRVLAFQNICKSSETAKIIKRMLMGRNLWSAASWSKQDYHQVWQGFVWPHFKIFQWWRSSNQAVSPFLLLHTFLLWQWSPALHNSK